jgi:hypothetical protein
MNELRPDHLVEPRAPTFDDERTVASARPVVPLAKIKTHRRIWLLGGAYALAMMLGVGIALLGAYVRLPNTPTASPAAATEISEPDLSSAPLVAADNVPSETSDDEGTVEESMEESPVVIEPATEATPRRRTRPRRNSVSDEPRSVPQASEDDELRRVRDAVLVDEWQERRARRVLRRERRRAERYNHRDLSNLDEIFEGPRRRRPPEEFKD